MRHVTTKIALVASALLLAGGAGSPVEATSFTFDDPLTLSNTAAPGTWYTDRYNPAGFATQSFQGDNRLAVTVSTADSQNNRAPAYSAAFYNTQGRTYSTPNAYSISIDMYLGSNLVGTGPDGRVGGLWSTAFTSANAYNQFNPVLEFFGGQWHGWTLNGWVTLSGGPGSWTLDKWYTLKILLNGTDVTYTVDSASLTTSAGAGTASLGNVIIQGYNGGESGINQTLYFDNLDVQQTPVPGAFALFLGGAGVLGFFARRRKAKPRMLAAQAVAA